MQAIECYNIASDEKPKRIHVSSEMLRDNAMCRNCECKIVDGWAQYRCSLNDAECNGTRSAPCFVEPKSTKHVAAGRKGGSVITLSKQRSARCNGSRGGRPKKMRSKI